MRERICEAVDSIYNEFVEKNLPDNKNLFEDWVELKKAISVSPTWYKSNDKEWYEEDDDWERTCKK